MFIVPSIVMLTDRMQLFKLVEWKLKVINLKIKFKLIN